MPPIKYWEIVPDKLHAAGWSGAMEDQSFNIRVLAPLFFFLNLSCALAINHWPDYFIDRSGNISVDGRPIAFVPHLCFLRDTVLPQNRAPHPLFRGIRAVRTPSRE